MRSRQETIYSMGDRAFAVPLLATLDRIGIVAGLRLRRLRTVRGGRSGAAKLVCFDERGRKYFLKFVTVEAPVRQRALMEREAQIVEQLPPHPALPRLVAVVDEPDLVAVLTEYVGRGSVTSSWDPYRADVAFATVEKLHRDLAPVTFAARHIELKPSRFTVFADGRPSRIGDMSPHNRQWLHTHRHELGGMERRARRLVHGRALIHCDLAVDNFVFDTDDRCHLVDWSHAHLGEPAYDMACMLVRIRADSAWSEPLDRSVMDYETRVGDLWRDMMLLAASNFMQRSEGENENPQQALSRERLRYAEAAVDWLREIS